MKKFFEPFIIILSVYTRIPMPMVYWNSSNLRYAFCFLPVAGLAVGAVQAAWAALCCATGLSPLFGAAVMCAVPLMVTGGIHMDGFSDTIDALSSHAERQKKLEIMDDPHMGAFGAMWMIVYMMICAASYYEILFAAERDGHYDMMTIVILLLAIPVISRALTAFAISRIQPSKNKGMLYTFTSASNMKAVTAASIIVSVVALAVLALISPLFALICAALVILLFAYFRSMTIKQFGGISGDLCGWLIQTGELLLLAAAALYLQ